MRIFGYRILEVRKFHGFKRAIVPSDFDKKKLDDKKSVSVKEFESRGDKAGRNLYYPKYGNSIYDAQLYKPIDNLDEIQITNTTDYKNEDNRPDYDDEYFKNYNKKEN